MSLSFVQTFLETVQKSFQEGTTKTDLIGGACDSFHVLQEYKWDCGLACCLMVLKWLDREVPTFSTDRNSPLWTIELFCLLKQNGVTCELHTNCIGFETHHLQFDWYAKNCSEKEQEKIETATKIVVENGWNSHIHLVNIFF